MQFGRIEILTDEPVITEDNIISVLQKAWSDHQRNATRIKELLEFEAGNQPLMRTKTYRSDINCECVDNVANEVTEFNLGFKWGNPITLVQRGESDEEKEHSEAIFLLNKCYEAENIKSKTQELGRYIEICGVGYTFVDINTEWQDGDSFFNVDVLNPMTTFVIKSSYYIDKRVMIAVTFRKSSDGNTFYTCYTRDARYDVMNFEKITYKEQNILGRFPIIEWIRSYDRMGCFERQISEMNNLNLLISDFTNDVDQNTQAIWHGNDIEFPKEIVKNEDGTTKEIEKRPKTNDWMLTKTSSNGRQPFVKPLAVEYDYPGMLQNIMSRRSLILQKCNVPQRNDNSGGSTGIAMSDATGWSAAESAACKQQNITESNKMEEVKVVLAAIKNSPDVPADSPLLNLNHSDVQPNIKRQKTYELSVKTNAIVALLSKGFALEDAISIAPLFEDPNQVIVRSGEGVKAYQDAQVFKSGNKNSGMQDEKRPFPDYSDEESQSPRIGGMETNNSTNQTE